MLKKTITYKNFNEEMVMEDHFFHLSKADLIELELSTDGGMEARLKTIVDSGNNHEIFGEFKKILLMAYGERSEDGKRFIKTQAIRDYFVSTEAYSTLLMTLLEDENAAAAFINGIIPQGLNTDTVEIVTAQPDKVDAQPRAQPRTLTQAEMLDMDSDTLKSGLAAGRYVIES